MKPQTVRSPRRTDFTHQATAQIPLNDKTPPAEDSISWKLWLACEDLAQDALQTQYMLGVKNGTLDPNRYGQYTIQDAVYCHHAEAEYQTIEQRAVAAGETTLAAFAEARRASYASYNAETFEAWHIADADAISPGDAAQTYIDFERSVATERDPIYGVLMMIPCDQLWPYLATELKDSAGDGNLYGFWITGNGDWGGAYRLDNFIDDWFAAHPETYCWDTALFVYRSCMTCEVNFFRSACGQELLPMPTPPSK